MIFLKEVTDVSDLPENQTAELKSVGLKATTPRLRILELFQRRSEGGGCERRHLSAEDVYKELVNQGVEIGFATVYRVLTQFEQANILVRHHFDSDRAMYELEEGQHHDHLVCLGCGKVVEFVDPEIERAQLAVAERYGYQLCDHSLVLYGICHDCGHTDPKEKNDNQ